LRAGRYDAVAADPSLDEVFSVLGPRGLQERGQLEIAPAAPADGLLAGVWTVLEGVPETARPGAESWSRPWLAEVFEALLLVRCRERAKRLDEHRTPPAIAELVVTLAGADGGAVVDPAAGEAGFLLASWRAARRRAGEPAVVLAGCESDPGAWRIARQRLLVHRIPAQLRNADSLVARFSAEGYDAVVCDPPFGAGVSGLRAADERWRYGIPAASADVVWVQLAVALLRAGGRAAVLLPEEALQRGGTDAWIRLKLLEAGTVEAVIALAHQPDARTEKRLAIGLFKAPEQSPQPVLFINAMQSIAGARNRAGQPASDRGGDQPP